MPTFNHLAAFAAEATEGDHFLEVPIANPRFHFHVEMNETNPVWSLLLIRVDTGVKTLLGGNKPKLDGDSPPLQAGDYLLMSHATFTEDKGRYQLVATTSAPDEEFVLLQAKNGPDQFDPLPVRVS